MPSPCVNHPRTESIGSCVACDRPGCAACLRQIDGDLQCREKCPADPLAGVDFAAQPAAPAPPAKPKSDLPDWLESVADPEPTASSLEDPTVVLSGGGAAAPDPSSQVRLPAWHESSATLPTALGPDAATPESPDSRILLPRAGDSSDTSILDMSALSGVKDLAAAEHLPLLLVPGTRRETIDQTCFRHEDTPAIVICGRCSRPICSICGADSPEGFLCSSPCTLKPRRRVGLLLSAAGFAAAAVFVIIAITGRSEPPPPEVARTDPPKVELPKPEPPKVEPPKVDPKPEPPKPEPPKPIVPKVEPKPEPPKVEPPKPEPPKVEPKPEPPKPEPPKPVVPKVEPKPEPPKVEPKPEPPKPTPPRAEPPKPVVVKVVPKPDPPPPPPPSPLVRAASLIREATPLFGEVAEVIDDPVLRRVDREVLLDRINLVRTNLQEARAIYAQSRASAPDPAVFDRRIEALDQTLQAVPAARERIRVADATEKAARRIREATALGNELADGTGSNPEDELDRTVRRVKVALMKDKLREARTLYASIRDQARDPELLDARIKKLDGLLRAFGAP